MNRKYLFGSSFIVLSLVFCSVCSAGEWKSEYQRLCGNTENADSLATAELTRIISECEKVESDIKQSADPEKKVYLFRIKKCRNFYMFMKDIKK